MKKFDPQNERLKLEYQHYLRHAHGLDHKTIDKVMAAIRQFEKSTGCKPFKKFKIEQAMAFKDWIETAKNSRTGRPLSPATVATTLRALREFFKWMPGQHGYKKAIGLSDWTYFKHALKDARIARTPRPRQVPSVEHSQRAFEAMCDVTSVEKRNKALFAFLMLTGARIAAVASLRIKHVDLERKQVFQDAREVRTKNAKTMETTFFPMGSGYIDVLADYLIHLKQDLMFGPEDVLFPKTKVVRGPNGFQVAGLTRLAFTSTGPLSEIIKEAFTSVQMPGYTPHSFRHMLALHGDKVCKTREEFKAWSQNLGHENALVTVSAYMPVTIENQRRIVLSLDQ